MPDLTGLAALDVFIGMAFLFFLLSTVCAGINEVAQTVLNARGRMLVKGLVALLEDPAHAKRLLLEDWELKRLRKPAGAIRAWWARRGSDEQRPSREAGRLPSYIPARSFALAILREAAQKKPIGKTLVENAQATVDRLGPPALARELSGALTDLQRDAEALRVEIERRFDEAMDRVSGWYKRYVQWWLVAIALIVSIGLNVDSFRVADRLLKDDSLRAAVVQQATEAAEPPEDGTPPAPADTPREVAEQIDAVEQLGLPIGWSDANTTGSIWSRLAGWLVTAFALSLGAPFWFDVLGKAARLRNVGNREGTQKDSARAAEDRDDPSRIRPAPA